MAILPVPPFLVKVVVVEVVRKVITIIFDKSHKSKDSNATNDGPSRP